MCLARANYCIFVYGPLDPRTLVSNDIIARTGVHPDIVVPTGSKRNTKEVVMMACRYWILERSHRFSPSLFLSELMTRNGD